VVENLEKVFEERDPPRKNFKLSTNPIRNWLIFIMLKKYTGVPEPRTNGSRQEMSILPSFIRWPQQNIRNI
jgi:hypothetical protein